MSDRSSNATKRAVLETPPPVDPSLGEPSSPPSDGVFLLPRAALSLPAERRHDGSMSMAFWFGLVSTVIGFGLGAIAYQYAHYRGWQRGMRQARDICLESLERMSQAHRAQLLEIRREVEAERLTRTA